MLSFSLLKVRLGSQGQYKSRQITASQASTVHFSETLQFISEHTLGVRTLHYNWEQIRSGRFSAAARMQFSSAHPDSPILVQDSQAKKRALSFLKGYLAIHSISTAGPEQQSNG